MSISEWSLQAGDAKSWVMCRRRAWFERHPPAGFVAPPPDDFERLVMKAGMAHEAHVAQALGTVVQAGSASRTQALMAAQALVIGQAVLEAPGLGGRPDFLVLQPDGRYQVVDAKLAAGIQDHPEIRIQLALYRRLLGNGLPALAWLSGDVQTEVGDEADAEADRFLTAARAEWARPEPPDVAFAESRCGACPFDAICRPAFQARGELTLLHGVTPAGAAALRRAGVPDVPALAAADDHSPPAAWKGQASVWHRRVLQARSVVQDRAFLLAPPQLPAGTWVHFDVEADPLSPMPKGEVYLWGLLPPQHRAADYQAHWSDGGPAADEAAWRSFLAALGALRQAHPDLVLAHYSPYERTQIQTYADRYGDRAHPVVRWLLGKTSPLFDLRPAVLDSLVLPLGGYGLKAICKHPRLVNFQWELAESGSQWSVVRYAAFRAATTDRARAAIRAEVESYNRDDVRATHALEQWLRGIAAGKGP